MTAIDYDAVAHDLEDEATAPLDVIGPALRDTLLSGAAAIRALRAELEATQAGLKDPATVLVNMMRGHIANPHADTAKRNDELCTENEALRAALAERERNAVIPDGWVFYSADASLQSNDPRRPMSVLIRRDVDGKKWWLSLSDEDKEATQLYASGAGMTIKEAIQNAVEAMAAQEKANG